MVITKTLAIKILHTIETIRVINKITIEVQIITLIITRTIRAQKIITIKGKLIR